MHNDNMYSALFQAGEQTSFASPTVAWRVNILPATWAMLDLTLRYLGIVAELLKIAILPGTALIFFVIGANRYKWE